MIRELLYPTPFYSKDLPNSKELNLYLLKQIKLLKKQDPKGVIRTNSGFGWHSQTNLNEKKEFEPIIKELVIMANQCNEDYFIKDKIILGNMWANINPTYSYNKLHTHQNSIWSGVYYVKVPKDSGGFYVDDPRSYSQIFLPNRKKDTPALLNKIMNFNPVEGRLIFFPSWLPHGVDINMNKQKGEKNWRVSISFNFAIKYEF